MTYPDYKSHLAGLFEVAANKVAPDVSVTVELIRPKQASHGDYACNLAMQLAKPLKKNPRELAALLIDALPDSPYLEKTEAAGAGFINLFLKASAKRAAVAHILARNIKFGCSDLGAGKKVLLEYVSANPTGPLHVGHGRGAAIGASLANVLEATGYTVSREFYVNDAGRQMDILALSIWLRYLQADGFALPFDFPGNAYQGEYVRDMARHLLQIEGARYRRTVAAPAANDDTEAWLDALIALAKSALGKDYAALHRFVLTWQLDDCRDDLLEFGVTFDTWFSEQSLFDDGRVAAVVERLEQQNFLYEQDGAKWFRSTAFGDEKDRVVQRENGLYTYFASDIAYHVDKFQRGFARMIDLWGADHHGYIPRVKGAITALGLDPDKLEVALVQFAVLYRAGEKISMSTRSGEFVTLRELREEVGNDAARFFYVMRKSDQHLDFDLDLAKSQSNDNPVYYVQYAHARICSVLLQAAADVGAGALLETLAGADTAPLDSEMELALLKKLIDYPDTVAAAAVELSPHLIAFYLKELAAEFHSYYNATRFLVPEVPLRHARLALIVAVKQVLANGLALLGVSAPEKM